MHDAGAASEVHEKRIQGIGTGSAEGNVVTSYSGTVIITTSLFLCLVLSCPPRLGAARLLGW